MNLRDHRDDCDRVFVELPGDDPLAEAMPGIRMCECGMFDVGEEATDASQA